MGLKKDALAPHCSTISSRIVEQVGLSLPLPLPLDVNNIYYIEGMSFHQERKNGNSILKSSARIAAKLNYLSPQLFPAPGFWSQNDSSSVVSMRFVNYSTSNSVDIVAAENLLRETLNGR
ncbi:hypothetical protein HPP92_023553 [Vanilla planifolia]|uniref:Uncharacterized protein n=1 Tax=Vanilla planifolia TaxID=51239 RepID=A0A835PKT9_VANPL|nr:hypothetical protein HPP92_023553 [Vanilla planifolia]